MHSNRIRGELAFDIFALLSISPFFSLFSSLFTHCLSCKKIDTIS